MRNKFRPLGRRPRIIALMALGCLTAIACSPGAAWAQAPGGSLATSYSANADKPINIEADALEVDDKKKIATFKGNVSATQGDFNIRAKEIQVLYTAAAKKAPGTPAAPASASSGIPGGGNADIQQIDARGKVLVTTKDNQTTTSDWAVFEVKKQLVTIGGDVVVTQGTDTIKGSKLVIDLTTGLTRLDTAANDKDAVPGKKERIQMLITPKNHEKPKGAKSGDEKAH
jgi:lipopolysaccharide export system protein LptA